MNHLHKFYKTIVLLNIQLGLCMALLMGKGTSKLTIEKFDFIPQKAISIQLDNVKLLSKKLPEYPANRHEEQWKNQQRYEEPWEDNADEKYCEHESAGILQHTLQSERQVRVNCNRKVYKPTTKVTWKRNIFVTVAKDLFVNLNDFMFFPWREKEK